jgi:hypothetical protein
MVMTAYHALPSLELVFQSGKRSWWQIYSQRLHMVIVDCFRVHTYISRVSTWWYQNWNGNYLHVKFAIPFERFTWGSKIWWKNRAGPCNAYDKGHVMYIMTLLTKYYLQITIFNCHKSGYLTHSLRPKKNKRLGLTPKSNFLNFERIL